MRDLEQNTKPKSCCQQKQNDDSQIMPLGAELDCCGSASSVEKANLLPVISDQIGGVTRVAVGQVTETKGSGHPKTGFRQMLEFRSSSPSNQVPAGCGCGPGNEASLLNVKAKGKLGFDSGHRGQVESNSSKWITQNHQIFDEFEVWSPVGEPSQVSQQNGTATKTQQVENVLFECESNQKTNTDSHQDRTEQPAVTGSKSLVDHSNSLSDGALGE